MECKAYSSCDERCAGESPHMHYHSCGYPLRLAWSGHVCLSFCKENCKGESTNEAVWGCTNPECGKEETVMSGIRESPLDCDCYWMFEN